MARKQRFPPSMTTGNDVLMSTISVLRLRTIIMDASELPVQ
ncbi:hypothetical protein PY479_09895 [Shewanella sp. A32]|nr:hypothetical protein [Shewanella sp. A32]MDF0534582.1 hypothetical protein [Shewanella sp. A32]